QCDCGSAGSPGIGLPHLSLGGEWVTSLCSVLQLKYMKELEQEKDVLLQGLELIDRARAWYCQHIQLMQEHQRLLGKKRTSAVSLGLLLAALLHAEPGQLSLSQPLPAALAPTLLSVRRL
uniref:Suppressor APC domain containing 2 n=1 Tax=Cyanistes caeruleus TaxID=156563 RepID=A0A8C0VTT5_CYACU